MRFSKAIFIILTVLIIIVAGFFGYDFIEKIRIDTRGFSDTQTWDPLVYAQKNNFTPLVGEAVFSLTLAPPPANSSDETKQELAYLHDLAANRTETQLADIHSELAIDTTQFGPFTYRDLRLNKPKTRELIDRILSEFSALVIVQKERFDRVRPNFLDTTLMPAITVPNHPAYPSGHAAQSKIITLVLRELDPIHAQEYDDSATRIAHNREIAGVHYPSDSRAGEQLAENYFLLLRETMEFKNLVDAARVEW